MVSSSAMVDLGLGVYIACRPAIYEHTAVDGDHYYFDNLFGPDLLHKSCRESPCSF